DGGEAAAQRFPGREPGGNVDRFGVHVRLHRHPNPLEDLRGFAEDEGFAEGLREVVWESTNPGVSRRPGRSMRAGAGRVSELDSEFRAGTAGCTGCFSAMAATSASGPTARMRPSSTNTA